MNNFNGQLNLYPEICIDNFSSNILYNLKIHCFILTHFHDDHMKNLEDFNFYRLLKENTDVIKFYCSSITKKFIQTCEKYEHLYDYCTEVPCESPFIVKISSKDTVTVSFCGSGHCPGSVMAFIEGPRGNVLFTGDFRLPLHCASRLPFFKHKNPNESSNQMKSVDHLYVDMTFFKPEIRLIPTREESCKELLKFLNQFLALNKQDLYENLVYLKTSARIGYEYIYQEIHRVTGFKVHVNGLIYKIYDKLPQIQSSLTTDPYETPIHACIYENRKRDAAKTDLMTSSFNKDSSSKMRKSYSFSSNLTVKRASDKPLIPCVINYEEEQECSRQLKVNAVKIILSAMWFTDTAGIDKLFFEYKPPKKDLLTPAYRPYKSVYRLCYSFHSSLEEIVDFVDTLRPKKLYSIALPESTSEEAINDYFYAQNGKFTGFKLGNAKMSKSEGLCLGLRNVSEVKSGNKLVLRKRKSYESKLCDSETSNEDLSDESDDLKFGDSGSDSEVVAKKNRKNSIC